MKLIITSFLVFLLLPFSIFAQQAKQLIIGEWKSNRELTAATVQFNKPVSPELRAKFENLFGRMTVTYTEHEMSAFTAAYDKYPDWSFTSSYQVTAATDKKLVITSLNPNTKQQETTTITFEGPDRYWVPLEKIIGKEYFDRVPKSSTPPSK